MAVRKIKAGRVSSVTIDQFVGEQGTIFYDDVTGEMRLANGVTAGGFFNITNASNALGSNLEIDGGNASTNYTAEIIVDGGVA